MKTPNFRRHRVAAAVAGAVLALGATQALATGFQLNEQSASSIGNAFAGGAAFTDDISAMWWNPAVLSKFERRQFVQGLHVVVPSIEFINYGSVPALNQPLGGNGGVPVWERQGVPRALGSALLARRARTRSAARAATAARAARAPLPSVALEARAATAAGRPPSS